MAPTHVQPREQRYAPPAAAQRQLVAAPAPAADSRLGRFAAWRLLQEARRVARETGKSVTRQLAEVAALRLADGRLRPLHYYQYQLYDDRVYPWSVKREFIDWDPTRIGKAVNDGEWKALAKDKTAFATFMRGAGIPHAAIVALFHPGGRQAVGAATLRTRREAAEFLRSTRYPLFGKPVYGRLGSGAALIEGYDPKRDLLRMADGSDELVEAFVERIALRFAPAAAGMGARGGYLFQEVLVTDPDVAALAGERVSTLRMVVLMHDEGPRLFRCVWRMAVRPNVADNFADGRSGNVLALVDHERGVVWRAIRGWGTPGAPSDVRGPGEYVRTHPDTGREIVGIRVPQWNRVLALALAASKTLPRIRYQSWDIALTAQGPVAVELNFHGHVPQPGQLRGFHDPVLRAFLARYGRN